MKDTIITFKVNLQKLLACIALLRDQFFIAKLVGPKPPIQHMNMWLQILYQELIGRPSTFCRSIGKVFF